MDRLRAFEVFATVVAKGSFIKAADALDTSPANVTRYVNELEGHLATRLLNRSSRKLSLTESGTALYERCRAILDDVAEAEAIASHTGLNPRGRLRINAGVTFGIKHLSPLWPVFMKKYPEINLDIDLIDRVVDMVEEGYDLTIRVSQAVSPANLVAKKLATSRNLVCAAPAYLKGRGMPKTPQDLREHTCLGFSYAATGDEWHFTGPDGKAQRVRITCPFHTNNGETLRAAALAGHGIIRPAAFLVGEDIRAGRLVRLLPDYQISDTDLLALYPSRRHVSAKVRVMLDFLGAAFKGTPPWDRDLLPYR
ncbi:LysR family transcriptional regulator [Dongia rigui]|uniref:LysR family transcriptional regulator n=1 Tax=Dongia rigui TaxID=940149 RepID=A0ABU5DVS0_9PROT|nr:LysR family transcriptional regulator [Dongia rigui]MDY0871374.1 LysR family transcriptional regulator [Dongia rigui]